MMITLQHVAFLQETNREDVSVTYLWKRASNTPEAVLDAVRIEFKNPNVELWKYLMTETTQGFEINIWGTRNETHDGLMSCYLAVLPEVNEAREKIGLAPVKS